MEIGEEKLKEILVEPGYVKESDFESARKQAQKSPKALREILVEKEIILDRHLGRLIAEYSGYKFINLSKKSIPQNIIKIVPEVVARNQKVIVFSRTKEGLKLAMADPENFEMIEWLEKKTGEEIDVYYATPRDIRDALKYYKKELSKTFEEIIAGQAERARKERAKAEDIPVIKIVDTIIEYAYENRASDIHIEPLKNLSQVRFRIDGALHNVLTLPKDIHGLISTRIKVLSELRTDEHFAAQDGRFSIEFSDESFDVRVSIVPVTEGEKVVMRLLSERSRRFNLGELGFSDSDLERTKRAIRNPYGMILATGPTGCGKTTTLYSILKALNKPEVNICTIEDPVEYDISGINQIQVNPETNLTFAKGLRSVVRQDPDIIMIGEIRDEETAKIAVNSAMTGHLVLSTMHANTAATNIPRLTDMGVEPFLVASSTNIIIAQRLVRKICMKCRESYTLKGKELENFKSQIGERVWNKMFGKDIKEKRLYRGSGCKNCNGTGYIGRIGIFEVLETRENIKRLILEKVSADQIEAQAIENGMTTMLEDGVRKVLNGVTTVEEVIRATKG